MKLRKKNNPFTNEIKNNKIPRNNFSKSSTRFEQQNIEIKDLNK